MTVIRGVPDRRRRVRTGSRELTAPLNLPPLRVPVHRKPGKAGHRTGLPLTERQNMVLSHLASEPLPIAVLRARTGLTGSQVSSVLSSLSARGLVHRRPGEAWRADTC